MKEKLLLFTLIILVKSSFACTCSKRPDEFYDFIALVIICNNEPYPSQESRRSLYQSAFEIIELYKGPELAHILGFGSVDFASDAACEQLYRPGEEWIIFSKYSHERNDFITSYCCHNFRHRSKEGRRNWERSNPNYKIDAYRKK